MVGLPTAMKQMSMIWLVQVLMSATMSSTTLLAPDPVKAAPVITWLKKHIYPHSLEYLLLLSPTPTPLPVSPAECSRILRFSFDLKSHAFRCGCMSSTGSFSHTLPFCHILRPSHLQPGPTSSGLFIRSICYIMIIFPTRSPRKIVFFLIHWNCNPSLAKKWLQ